MEQLKEMHGLFMVHIPYKGASAALTNLIGGRTEVGINFATIAMRHVQSGRVRALAVAGGSARKPWLTDVPTAAELGMTGLDGTDWTGFVGQELQLLPRQPVVPPAVDLPALEVLVGLALEAVHHIHHLGEARGLERFARGDRAFARTAQQHHGPGLVAARFTLDLAREDLGVRLHLGVFVPGHVHDTGRVADVEIFDLHAHVDEQRARVAPEVVVGLAGGEVLHRWAHDESVLSTMYQ
jgi:hypothetical protein